MLVRTRSRALTLGVLLLRKHLEPQKGKKTRRLESKKLTIEALETKQVTSKIQYWILTASEPSNWIIDQSAIFEYNPFTCTILKYSGYSTGDTQQVKNLENPED